MQEAVVRIHYPRGTLPVRGFRCPVCGEEEVLAQDAQALQDMARQLGFSGVENRRRRKLQKHGNSTTVSLDPEFLRKHGKKAGDTVVVAERGDELVILPDEE
jgi:general stress protein YciG